MTFPHFKHSSLVLINLILILKELAGDYKVTTKHLSMQFKMLFRDRVLSHSWLWFGHLLIKNFLKTYLEHFYDPFLVLMHKANYFKIFLLGKGFQMLWDHAIKKTKKKVLYTKNSWPNFTFIDLRGNEQIIYNIFL